MDRAEQNPGCEAWDRACRTLLEAYAVGLFPMGEPGGALHWFDPDPRGVIPLEPGGLRVSRSLRQRVRSGRFEVTSDEAFGEVIRACAAPRPGRDGGETWIDERIIALFDALHDRGHAHSVEAWVRSASGGRTLVGGLYGVHLRGLFAGESMFSRPEQGGTDASKVCLVHLVAHLRERGFTLLDTQFQNDHLRRLGCVEIPRETYRRRLEAAMSAETDWGDPDPARVLDMPEVRGTLRA
ncbi:MAG: leucyl/phenylalanyl-tRNA--protein transferase [Phycisphaerales bacterium JB059]